MGGLSLWHVLILGLVVVLLFGRGRISNVMEELGSGIKSFKKGIADEQPEMKPINRLEGQPVPPTQTVETPDKSETH
ncbi:MAG: twin-arginine translocase TatA/TatE family subunit [Alphaproteobacteria bacterium]|nr:twin-arginine translocase TatA/TatE family subunit [Alphaproteobacteria bacterium]MDE2042036.1 twin-arginine translocase TatA/TatE family subunit [Alphaproteobacteria bacterium]MDE2341358.1 twin-arginine translocase TatA/TatE family subunit [Alphaproteobacteria bacterium]